MEGAIGWTDAELVAAVHRGDHPAFGVLVERWSEPVLGAAREVLGDQREAAEVATDTFHAVWNRFDQLQQPDGFGPWAVETSRSFALHRRAARDGRGAPDVIPLVLALPELMAMVSRGLLARGVPAVASSGTAANLVISGNATNVPIAGSAGNVPAAGSAGAAAPHPGALLQGITQLAPSHPGSLLDGIAQAVPPTGPPPPAPAHRSPRPPRRQRRRRHHRTHRRTAARSARSQGGGSTVAALGRTRQVALGVLAGTVVLTVLGALLWWPSHRRSQRVEVAAAPLVSTPAGTAGASTVSTGPPDTPSAPDPATSSTAAPGSSTTTTSAPGTTAPTASTSGPTSTTGTTRPTTTTSASTTTTATTRPSTTTSASTTTTRPTTTTQPSPKPPVVTITTPDGSTTYTSPGIDKATGYWYVDVRLSGSATDPEDGALTGTSLRWTTSRSDLQKANLGTGPTVSVRLYGNVCLGSAHTITLTATDSANHQATATRQVTVAAAGC